MPSLLGLYHALPPGMRSLAATLRGSRLSAWRYGAGFESLVEQAIERDTWSPARWKAWQDERLGYILNRAATRVPYYRKQWAERRRKGDTASWNNLQNWPILRKEDVRSASRAFVADDCRVGRLYRDHTSGTTGTPMGIWLSRSTVRQQYALSEARLRRWHGVSRHEWWGIIGGQVVVPFKQGKPPYWVRNAALKQVYFSALHIAPWSADSYLEAIRKYRLSHLIVYTNSLCSLASQLPPGPRPVKSDLRVIVTNAEPLFDFQRRIIEAVFGCPVRETYGLVELVAMASECEQGSMHWWPECGLVEILDDDGRVVSEGATGHLIATGLLNADMPLIRYDTQDMTTRRLGQDYGCKCGRDLPLAGKFVGRHDDAVTTRDGRRLFQVDTILAPDLGIKEAQIIQHDFDRFTVKVVTSEDWTSEAADRLKSELRKRVGDVEVTVQRVDCIPKTWAGKFRIIVSELARARR
jgi:phenylacetate-CoA ligase